MIAVQNIICQTVKINLLINVDLANYLLQTTFRVVCSEDLYLGGGGGGEGRGKDLGTWQSQSCSTGI